MPDRDVVWVTLESVRQDHTSLGGHERNTTPNLAELGVEGTAFNRCYSHDIWTRSSSASILTGHTPSAHQTWSTDAKLPDSITTVPEAFRDAGFRTACVSPNGQLSHATGLDRGFDHFHYLVDASTLVEEAGVRAIAKWLLNFRRHTGGLIRDGNQQCIGYLSNSIAKRHIDAAADGDGPLFLYVHHGDSHHAYVPPLAWRRRFRRDLPMSVDEAVALALEMSDRLHEFIACDDPFTEDQWRALQVLYDTCLAYVDQLTGDLVDYARRRLDDPIAVVTADHGELFGEHGLLAHMLVTDAAISNVPLVVVGLDGLDDERLIQHADVIRMLCSDLGIDHSVPVGRDIRENPRKFAVTQRGGGRARRKLAKISEYNDDFPVEQFHGADLTSLRTESWCYRRSDEGTQLFVLPDEDTDRTDEFPTETEQLEADCRAWLEEFGRPAGETGTAEFDATTQEQLRNLGYL